MGVAIHLAFSGGLSPHGGARTGGGGGAGMVRNPGSRWRFLASRRKVWEITLYGEDSGDI